MDAFILKRADVLAAHPCSMDPFDQSPRRKGDACVYPDGFTPEEATRIAKTSADFLLWLARHKLVPMSVEEARALCVSLKAEAEKGA